MPDKPILIFPAATISIRQGLTPNRSLPPPRPSKGSQGPQLVFRHSEPISACKSQIDPEQVIVLETIGSVTDFQNE